jgi:hypothetical protein
MASRFKKGASDANGPGPSEALLGQAAALGLPIRPMAPEEEQLLRGRLRAPAAGAVRVVGIIAGLGALLLALTFFAGTPYDPDIFPTEVLILGVVAAACGGGAASLVGDPRAALERAEVMDVTYPMAPGATAPSRLVGFQVGAVDLQVPQGTSGLFLPGQAQRLVLALGLRPTPQRVPGIWPDRALLLSVNGMLLPKPVVVYYRLTVAPTAPGPPPLSSWPVPTVAVPNAVAGGPEVFCNQCGEANTSDYRFCSRCGARRP